MMIPYFMQHGCTIRKAKARLEVAAIMGVSRVTVVKYLQTARENGLVHINLDVNVFGSIDAALQIRDKFNLQRVIIVPDGEHAGKRDDTKLMRTRLSRAGGMYLNQVIENGDVLGLPGKNNPSDEQNHDAEVM